jgi:hypothetical protein
MLLRANFGRAAYDGGDLTEVRTVANGQAFQISGILVGGLLA